MSTITVLLTRRHWNPVSWGIRWAMPRSRFAFALSSHAIVVGPDKCFEATMLHGVRGVDRAVALARQTVVRELCFSVPDAQAGLRWAQEQAEKKVPYDWRGAFGLSLAPGRDWAEDDRYFCYEFAAAVLKAAGRPMFANLSHVGEIALLAVAP
ncbi:hypothetical protein ASC94_09255 [Massilia sp. Root418]|uniref:hypothetical protein n=1 Tax=Massilia sp. Root418 TaxID=1736532 RepID=UPI0006FEBC54|nr:hypothetical protein [Massilia sp. Root418]KQW96984.1 hypothetical protein ASC94_09255 [Massilia sp. Root418]